MLLGIAGVIPFVGAVAIVIFGPPGLVETATFSLLAYGAIILSFLGGILWGSVLARGFTDIGNDHIRLLVISVLPSLCGWVAPSGPKHWLTTNGYCVLVCTGS